jgi:hypothetical protein
MDIFDVARDYVRNVLPRQDRELKAAGDEADTGLLDVITD